MKRPAVNETVFQRLFPVPKPGGPATWTQHVQRNLVPEVREEVQRYFGRIDCLEAQYPGLDYTYDPHRRRLGSFTSHRRLFRAFDELRLTSDEILALCNWEGTRAAKERFERESKTVIESTTLEGVEIMRNSDGPRAVLHDARESAGSTPQPAHVSRWAAMPQGEISDDEDESFGVHLNQNLIAAAAARERGEMAHFDAQWEQWMKDAIERNDLDPETIRNALLQGQPLPSSLAETIGSGVQDSSSNPIDQHITQSTPMVAPGPQYQRLRDAVDELESSDARIASETADLNSQSSSSSRPRTRSSVEHARLSTLVEELHSNNTRMQAENSALQNFLARTRTETAR